MRALHGTCLPRGVVLIAAGILLLSNIPAEAAAPARGIVCDQCEQADRFVRLQAASDNARSAGAPQFSHPFVLSPEDWTSLLTGLSVRRQAEGVLLWASPGSITPAFTAEEIGYLSVALSQAFAQAQPHDWVVFGLSRPTSYGMTEVTTGGWFLEGSSLHIVLANYRKTVTMPSTRRLLWELPLRPDAGPAYDLVAGPHQKVVRESSAPSSLFSPDPSELMITYQSALLGEAAESPAGQESSAPHPKTAPPPLSIEDRLRALKRLHAEGLITDQEYRTKKQQILEQF